MKKATVRSDELGVYLQLDGFRVRPSYIQLNEDFDCLYIPENAQTSYSVGDVVTVETHEAGVLYELPNLGRRTEFWEP